MDIRAWDRVNSATHSRLARGIAARRERWGVLALLVAVLAPMLAVIGMSVQPSGAATGPLMVSGVTFPFNGVWLDSADGGHYWDASGNGLCRIDPDPANPGSFIENVATCDVQAKKPTQAVTDYTTNPDGTYFVYASDMSSKSGGPLRLKFDPNGASGAGSIVPASATLLGGANTVGFFSDAGGNFKTSAVALGPCDRSPTSTIPASTPCKALYVGFERSKNIDRIDFVDQDQNQQAIENIATTADVRKGIRFGIGVFHHANGTDDLYMDELGGLGVSEITDVATCTPSAGAAAPTPTNPPVNLAGGCAASIASGITTTFPQGMAIQNDANGNGRYIYVADSPRNTTASVLRFNPNTGFQDVVSSTVSPYPSLINPGETVSTYTFIMGLAVNPHNGDLFIGDDPSFAVLVNPPLNVGHIFRIQGDANGVAPADCTGTSAQPTCSVPAPPSVVTPSLYAYGLTAPKGGMTFVPSDDGGHFWAGDHSQGLCRFDDVGAAPELHAYNPAACDDGLLLGSAGQTVYDSAVVPGSTNLHYMYVAQNDHLSPGVLRFTFDPSGDGGAGKLVDGSAIVMAPNGGLDGDKANGLSLGPCALNPDGTKKVASCVQALYMGGLLDGFIRRINNPLDDPRFQTVDVVAQTTEQRAGVGGKGINGTMGMIGDDLYLPENQGFTVVKNISKCPTAGAVCATNPLPIGQFGFIFGSAVGVDTNPAHSKAGLVYTAISPGLANATIYQYDVFTNTARIFTTQGRMPAAGSAAATVYCTTTCTRPVDPANPPGGLANFHFAQGITTDDNGTVYLTEDAFAGARGGRGHAWFAPFVPFPAPVAPAPTITSFSPASAAPGATVNINGTGLSTVNGVTFNGVQATSFAILGSTTIAAVVPPGPATGLIGVTSANGPATSSTPFTVIGSRQCAVTLNVPALASGQSYWVQFTAHAPGPISSTWTIPTAGSAKLLLYPGNPFTGLADPVAKGSVGGSIASQSTSNTTSFSISSGSQPVGTYTVQMFNGNKNFGATTATVTFLNSTANLCPATPTALHVLP